MLPRAFRPPLTISRDSNTQQEAGSGEGKRGIGRRKEKGLCS